MAKAALTIYLAPELKSLIEERSEVFKRSQTQEIEFLIQKGLEFEELKSNILLEHGVPKEKLI